MSLVSLFKQISTLFHNWCLHHKQLTIPLLDKEMHNLHRVLDIRQGIEVPDVADRNAQNPYKWEMYKI